MFEEKCLSHNQNYNKGKGSYTVSEICQILGVCNGSARNLVKTHQFESVRIGREIRIIKSSFDQWLEGQKRRLHYGINSEKKK